MSQVRPALEARAPGLLILLTPARGGCGSWSAQLPFPLGLLSRPQPAPWARPSAGCERGRWVACEAVAPMPQLLDLGPRLGVTMHSVAGAEGHGPTPEWQAGTWSQPGRPEALPPTAPVGPRRPLPTLPGGSPHGRPAQVKVSPRWSGWEAVGTGGQQPAAVAPACSSSERGTSRQGAPRSHTVSRRNVALVTAERSQAQGPRRVRGTGARSADGKAEAGACPWLGPQFLPLRKGGLFQTKTQS